MMNGSKHADPDGRVKVVAVPKEGWRRFSE
jgi:hypothetical protein